MIFSCKQILVIYCISLLFITATSSLNTAAEKDKILKIDTDAPCITSECHPDMGKKKYVHPIGINPTKCIICHAVISEGEHRFSPVPDQTSMLCNKCHTENATPPPDIVGTPPKVITKSKDVKLHDPFARGKCTICHDAHESNFFSHLKTSYPEGPYASYSIDTYGLCTNNDCHTKLQAILEKPRLLSHTAFRNGNLNLHFKHVNMKKGRTCKVCHRHHGSNLPNLLSENFQFGTRTLTLKYEKTDTGGICITPCHSKARYDRYEPVFNVIKSSPTPGRDATEEELKASRERDMRKDKESASPIDQEPE